MRALGAEIARPTLPTARGQPGRLAVAQARAEKFAAFEALAPLGRDADPAGADRRRAAGSCCREDAIIVADPGTPCPYFSAYYELRRAGRHFITNRAHGALGYALPAAVGAQFGRPAPSASP